MERPSESGLAGTRILDSTLEFRELPLASALESASSAGLAGAGDIGDMTGIVTASCSITTDTSRTAEFSPIAASIAPVDFTEAADFMAEEQEGSRADSTDSQVPIPGHLAVSIMAVYREAFPPAGSRASAEVSTAEAGVSTVEAAAGNSFQYISQLKIMEREVMHTNKMSLETLETFTVRFAWGFASTILLMLLLLALLLATGLASSSFAQDAPPRTFASAGEAASALFEAAKKEDEPALEAILGAGKEVTSSSDEVEDKLEREQFSQKYQEMHRLIREPDGSTVLYIGAENWPFPIPLASKNGEWYFDSARGKQEILFRRIGENEATAVEVCEQFALAKTEDNPNLASEDSITTFVQGLVAAAAANTDSKQSTPFHGYYFRVVTTTPAQEVNGRSKTKQGLKLIAFPAEYQSSGIMTFVVAQSGLVYKKDLGRSTSTVAPQIKAPIGASWHPESES
jgi:hypothetical protein